MKYLIDTNAWIGFFAGRPDFGREAKAAMISQSDECVVCIASVWEAAIKIGLGKLKLPYDIRRDLPRIFEDNGFEILPFDVETVASVKDLEPVHGDPFDRIQVVQARKLGIAVISRDPVFERYGLRRIW